MKADHNASEEKNKGIIAIRHGAKEEGRHNGYRIVMLLNQQRTELTTQRRMVRQI